MQYFWRRGAHQTGNWRLTVYRRSMNEGRAAHSTSEWKASLLFCTEFRWIRLKRHLFLLRSRFKDQNWVERGADFIWQLFLEAEGRAKSGIWSEYKFGALFSVQRQIEHRTGEKQVIMFGTVNISKPREQQMLSLTETKRRDYWPLAVSVRQRLSISSQAWRRQRRGAPRMGNILARVVSATSRLNKPKSTGSDLYSLICNPTLQKLFQNYN